MSASSSTPTPHPERRRSRRVQRRLPLVVEAQDRIARVVTSDISRHGASLHCRFGARPGDVVRAANLDLLRSAPLRVVRCERVSGNLRRIAVEILDPEADLWGDAYAE